MFRLIVAIFGFMLSWMLASAGEPRETDPGEPPKDGPPKDPPRDDSGARDEPFKSFSSKKEHDEYVEGLLRDRLARKDRKAEEDRREAERKAREKALEEQGEHKAIAEQRQQTIVEKDAEIGKRDTRIAELEAEIEVLRPHREGNEARVRELMEHVPESVKELLAERDPLKQLEWLDKNPELAGTQTNGKPKGSRPTGKPSGSPRPADDEKNQQRAARSTRAAFG